MARSELRNRWRSWLALAVLVAVLGGVVLASTAAGRRTASAFSRYDAQYGYDVAVFATHPLSKLATLPEVASVFHATTPAAGTPQCACRHPVILGEDLGVVEDTTTQRRHLFKLVSGRLPDPSQPDEALASFNFARDQGIHVGGVVRVPFFAPAQQAGILADTAGPPTGPTVAFRVVGIEAGEGDFPQAGTPSYSLLPGPAFSRLYDGRTVQFDQYIVRLRHGRQDEPAFERDVLAAGAIGTNDNDQEKGEIAAAIHPQAVGWWVLAVLAGLAALAVLAQALSRQSNVEAEEYRTLAAVGMGPRDLVALAMLRTLLIGVTGAAGAVLLAFALSALAPVGDARVAEPATGLQFDAVTLGIGGPAVVALVMLLALWPAYRTSHRADGALGGPARPSRVVARLAAAGAAPSTVIGVRRAIDRGRGRESVPVGSALGGAILAVAALCATAVFGASLSHLVATPRLYGQNFQIWFNGFQSEKGADSVASKLRSDPAIQAVTLGLQGPVEINGSPTHSIAGSSLEGPVLISVASGRLPVRPGEVALGSKTLSQAHASVGSSVRMTFPLGSGGSRTVVARVVGTASFPPDFGVVGLGVGAYMSIDGFVAAQCPPGPESSSCRSNVTQNPVLLVSATGPQGAAAVDRYSQQFRGLTYLPVTPDNLVSFGEAVNFPLIVEGVLVLFGLAMLLHTLVVSVARRRQEMGLLKAIGMLRHQAVAAVCWQATTIALVGLGVGLPLGIVLGRSIWHAFGVNIGVVPVTVIEVPTVVALSIGVLVIANVLAAGPAFISARAKQNGVAPSD